MLGQAYLLRNRYDVFYLRMIVPAAIRTSIGLTSREVRLSLRTKDRRIARRRLAERTIAMSRLFEGLEAWEIDAERRKEMFQRGLELIRNHGLVDLHDEFELDALTSDLSMFDLEAYVFAREHLQKKAQIAAGSGGGKSVLDQLMSELSGGDQEAYIFTPDQLDEKTEGAVGSGAGNRNTPAGTVSAVSQPEIANPVATGAQDDNRPEETLRTALERFAKSKRSVAHSATIDKYVSQVRLFIKIVSDGVADLRLSDLSVKRMQLYCDALHDLPRKISSDDPRTLQQLRATAGETMSARTRAAHARAVSMFLKWCEDQQYRMQPNLDRVLAPLRKVPKSKAVRKHFEDSELKAIFESTHYKQRKFERDSDYWVPILGLLAGAREAELCQLHASDVYQDAETSLWVIDINDDGHDKRVKTAASVRKIPMHAKLLELGFEKFAREGLANGQQRLFPDEHRNTRGEFDAFSKRFNRYLKSVRITKSDSQRLNFHSLRHTLQTDLLDQGVEEYIVNQLVGHSPSNSSQSVNTYSKGASLRKRRDVLETFRLNVSLFPR